MSIPKTWRDYQEQLDRVRWRWRLTIRGAFYLSIVLVILTWIALALFVGGCSRAKREAFSKEYCRVICDRDVGPDSIARVDSMESNGCRCTPGSTSKDLR